MHFCPIAPIAYLDRYAGRVHTQLALAQWCVRDERYFNWYRRRREQGDFVILDNGAYEGELLAPDELIRVAQDLRPSVLTVPDKINDYDESCRMALDFAQRDGIDVPLMRVLQHADRDPAKWVEMFRLESRRYRWLAFPRILDKQRVNIVSHCIQHRVLLNKIHAFGWIGSTRELAMLSHLGVTTADSSGPVWRGLNGFNLEDEWPDIPFNPLYDGWDGHRPTTREACGELTAERNLVEVLHACASL